MSSSKSFERKPASYCVKVGLVDVQIAFLPLWGDFIVLLVNVLDVDSARCIVEREILCLRAAFAS